MTGLKYNHYIGVKTSEGVKLVTKLENRTKQAFWDSEEKPLKLAISTAKDISWALSINGYEAFVITTLYDYEKQPFILKA